MVNDVVSFTFHADGLGQFVDIGGKAHAACDLASDFFCRRMYDVLVCLPGREYSKLNNDGAQSFETS